MNERKKEDNVLYYAEHPKFGGWYFTNLAKVGASIGCNRSGVEFHLDKGSEWKGWSFKTIEDGSDIPYGMINPSNFDVLKVAFTQQN